MPEIPKAPPSQISSEELERIFKNSGVVEEFYFPPEVPKPPSCFDEKKLTIKRQIVSAEKNGGRASCPQTQPESDGGEPLKKQNLRRKK